MCIMLLEIESPSNNNEYIYTINIAIYISYHFKSLHRPFCTSLLNYFVLPLIIPDVYVYYCVLCFLLYCYVGYEYTMCNFMPKQCVKNSQL